MFTYLLFALNKSTIYRLNKLCASANYHERPCMLVLSIYIWGSKGRVTTLSPTHVFKELCFSVSLKRYGIAPKNHEVYFSKDDCITFRYTSTYK